MQRERILIVEDEDTVRLVLTSLVAEMGHEAVGAVDVGSAIQCTQESEPAVALVDILLPDGSGLEILDHLRREAPDTVVIVVTSDASVDTAIEALRRGAYDYFRKPLRLSEVSPVVARAIEKRDLSLRNRELMVELDHRNRRLTAAVQRLASLNAAGLGMSGIQSLPELLEFFLDLLVRELSIDRASVMLFDEQPKLRIVASRGIDPEVVKRTAIQVGEGIAGQVVKTGEPILVEDAGTASSTDPDDLSLSAPIVLSVPIKTPDAILGAINVSHRTNGKPFDQDDVNYLRALAGQVAVAIERTRHLEQLCAAVLSLQNAHEQLLSSERLKILGELAAGVAHEFNNTLHAILGRSQLIRAALDEGRSSASDLRRGLEVIEQLSRQGALSVQRIQDSARIRKDCPADAVDLNQAVRLAVELTEPKWGVERQALGKPIEVVLELGDVPPATGTADDIAQVLNILILNAIEAMPNGGTLEFRTGVVDGVAVLEVADTGCGMTEELQRQIFEPFFTTKDHGFGLGLSIAFGTMTRLGGTISVETEPEVGSRFVLHLPLHDARQVGSTEAQDVTFVRTARVLVIEDEPVNRDLCKEILELHGHRVICAANGAEGLALLDAQSVDVVVTDLSMPGMSGWDVARRLHERDPHVPIVVLSGWGSQLSEDELRDGGIAFALTKPVEIDALLDAVQRVLPDGIGDIDASPTPRAA